VIYQLHSAFVKDGKSYGIKDMPETFTPEQANAIIAVLNPEQVHKVYLVWGWDSMASSMGDHYLDSIWATRELADACAAKLNDTYPKYQYAPRASVAEMTVNFT